MLKCDFFPEKRMKEIVSYVLGFMLTYDEMLNTNPLMCTNLRTGHFGNYSSFSYCTNSSVYRVFWPSSQVSK